MRINSVVWTFTSFVGRLLPEGYAFLAYLVRCLVCGCVDIYIYAVVVVYSLFLFTALLNCFNVCVFFPTVCACLYCLYCRFLSLVPSSFYRHSVVLVMSVCVAASLCFSDLFFASDK